MGQTDLWEETQEDIARGYTKKEDEWVCLLCGQAYADGYVIEVNGKMCDARRAAEEHVKAEHGSVFLHLLRAYGRFAGLTQHQAEVLSAMHEGLGDKAVAEKTTESSSTASVRNLRFQLKERERQAKAFLALMEAFRMERRSKGEGKMEKTVVHTGAALADERFEATEKERAAVLKAYFNPDGSLREFPVREKRKVIALSEIAGRFEAGRIYTEKEVNAIIDYSDFAMVRRYLVEYGYLERTPDCREYRAKEF